MSILKVARMGHPVLRQRARPLEPSEIRGAVIQKLIEDMFDTMHEYQGIGLAAPQVHESVRLFVAGVDSGEPLAPIVLINPELTPIGTAVIDDWEGCLSIPEIRGQVPRAQEIAIKAFDRRGKRLEMTARGYAARVIQHETDHLDGVLFFDRMRSFETLTYLDEFGRFWSREEVVPE